MNARYSTRRRRQRAVVFAFCFLLSILSSAAVAESAHLSRAGLLKPYIQSVAHICITTNHLSAEIHYYRDILGFRLISDGIRTGKGLSEGVGKKQARLRNVKLAGPNGFIIELIAFLQPPAMGRASATPIEQNAINHIGILVRDVPAVYALLKQAGYKSVSPPVTVAETGAQFFYGYDPDGNRVEFYATLN